MKQKQLEAIDEAPEEVRKEWSSTQREIAQIVQQVLENANQDYLAR